MSKCHHQGETVADRVECGSAWIKNTTVPAVFCGKCPYHDKPNTELPDGKKVASSGIGDTISKLLRRIGIKKRKGCGCSKRQAKLNQWWKFRE